MLKKSAFPALALIAAICGFFMRKQELMYEFEVFSGLAVTDGKWTTALMALSAVIILIAALSAVLAALANKKSSGDDKYSTVSFAASTLGGVMVTIGSLLAAGSGSALYVANTVRYIFAAFGILSGIGMAAFAAHCRFGYNGAVKQLDVVPSVFFCFWMVLIFHDNASNPVLLDFCFECLAMASSSIASIYIAGYSFGRGNAVWTLFSSILAIFFLGVAAAGATELSDTIVMIGTELFIFANAVELPMGYRKGELRRPKKAA